MCAIERVARADCTNVLIKFVYQRDEIYIEIINIRIILKNIDKVWYKVLCA